MSDYKLAAAHDNVAGLLSFELLSPPLLWRYTLGVKTEWHGQGTKLRAGDNTLKPIGRPWAIVVFDALNDDERQLLHSYAGDVTIQLWDKDIDFFDIFNGQWEVPEEGEETPEKGGWSNVRYKVTNLRRYSAFSDDFDPKAFGV
jgi:hypothetical protein